MRLLSYEWQHPNCSTSAPGWDWDDSLKIYDTDEDLKEKILELNTEIQEALVVWESSTSKWKDPKFIPPYRNIKIYDLSERHGNVLSEGLEYSRENVEKAIESQRWLYHRIEAVASLLKSPWSEGDPITFDSNEATLSWTEYRCSCHPGEVETLTIPFSRIWTVEDDASIAQRNKEEREAKERVRREQLLKAKEAELSSAQYSLGQAQQTLSSAPSNIDRIQKELEALRSSS